MKVNHVIVANFCAANMYFEAIPENKIIAKNPNFQYLPHSEAIGNRSINTVRNGTLKNVGSRSRSFTAEYGSVMIRTIREKHIHVQVLKV